MRNHKPTGFKLLACCAFLMLLAGCGQSPEQKAAIDAASESARKWLDLVDKREYSRSWRESSDHFKNMVKEKTWDTKLSNGRSPMGRVLERSVRTSEYLKSLPGEPAGEYVVIEYATKFENKKSTIERVVQLKDKSGEWKVSGYHVRQP